MIRQRQNATARRLRLLLPPVRIVSSTIGIRVLLPGDAVSASSLYPLVDRPPLGSAFGPEAAPPQVGARLHPVDGLVAAFLVLGHPFPAHGRPVGPMAGV